MGNDIIDRTQTEEELRKALQAAQARNAQYEQAVSMISDIVWRYDVNTKGEHVGSYISPVADRMLGLPAGTIGDSFEKYFSYVHPDDLPVVQEMLSEWIRTFGKDKATEYRMLKADGTMHSVRSKGSVYSHPDGRVTVVGTTCDITERKNAENLLWHQTEMMQTILDNIPVMIAFLDREGRHQLVNRCWQSTVGWSLEETMHKDVLTELYPDPAYREYVLDHIKRAAGSWGDFKTKTRDGRLLDTSWANVSLSDGSNIGIGIDITERKKMEEVLHESEEKLSLFMRYCPNLVYIKDEDTRAVVLSHHFENILGKPLSQLIGKTCEELWPPEFAAEMRADDEKVMKEGRTIKREETFEGRYYFSVKFPISRPNRPTILGGYTTDITERKQAEQELLKSEKNYRLLINNASESVIVAQDGLLKFVNPATLDLLGGGYSEQELIDRPFPEFIHPDDRSMVVENYSRRIANEAIPSKYAFRVVTHDGIVKWVEINATFIEWQGKPATLNFLTDITERMRAEKEVQDLKTQMEFILGATKTGLDIIDAKFNIHYIDPEWKKVYGDYAGHKCYQYFMDHNTPCPDCGVVKALQTKSIVVTEEVLLKENSRPIQVTTIPYQNDAGEWLVAEVNVDITDRKRDEEALKRYSQNLEEMVAERTKQLQQAARLATLGEMATMIGHDLRNPLQVIVSMVYLAKEMLTSADTPQREGRLSITEILDDIEKSCVYMNRIVSDLQSYAGPMNLELAETDIHKLISDALFFLEIPESVEVSIEVEKGLPEITIDPEKIKRVIVNLVNNSIQSMPKGGQITITAIRKGDSVVLTIKDEGGGISKEIIPKLFSPLFTTKAKGIGLGLAICKRLVEAHRGNIVVTSRVNAGTEVTIEIPHEEKTWTKN